uniref:Fibroblast growth factor n=1 Tax=Cacopsylla melanoneura TaxID=428564 RepID=A0A8D8WLP8_9HEMI
MLICWIWKVVLLLFCWSSLAAPILPSQDTNGTPRSERSANLSHITGTSRKIRMYVKDRYLKISPDGNVTGTNEDESEYTILQRSSVNKGQVKFQSVATCMFLCMDSCGLLYGSREWDEECIFNEMIELHNYNTYSSARFSNERRTLYLALNKFGMPRRVQLRGKQPLGKMSTYTRVLTTPVSNKRVEKMEKQPMRHHQLCPPHADDKKRKRNRKKKRRKCGGNGPAGLSTEPSTEKKVVKRKSEEGNEKSHHKKRKAPTNKHNLLYKEVPSESWQEHATSLPAEDNTTLPDLDMVEFDDMT